MKLNYQIAQHYIFKRRGHNQKVTLQLHNSMYQPGLHIFFTLAERICQYFYLQATFISQRPALYLKGGNNSAGAYL